MGIRRRAAAIGWGFALLLAASPARAGRQDCNSNDVDDLVDIATQYSLDCDGNGIPDECEMLNRLTYVQNQPLVIPDNDPLGASQDLVLTDAFPLERLELHLNIDHTWNGDISCSLTHVDTGTTIFLFDRIGVPEVNGGFGYDSNGFDVLFADTFPTDIETGAVAFGDADQIVGNFAPSPGALSDFLGENVQGTWRIHVSDFAEFETGTLLGWTLIAYGKNPAVDCNNDQVLDACQLANNDCNANQVPDDCEPDADHDTVPDACDACPGFDDRLDTDHDGVPDACDICPGFNDHADADLDGVPDGCDVCPGFDDHADADLDGIPDSCDRCPGFDDHVDTDGDTIPDGCDVCPGFDDRLDTDFDGVPDGCDVCPGFDDHADADLDGVPDGCDLCPGGNDSLDCDGDSIPDACDEIDCDNNGIPDNCDILAGAPDCNGNGVPDFCDIRAGTSEDCVHNGVPDECQPQLQLGVDPGPDLTMRLDDAARTLGGPIVAQGGIPPYQFAWSVTSGPNADGLLNATGERAVFAPTAGGEYVVLLAVSDSSAPPCVRSASVHIQVLALSVNAGPDRDVCLGSSSTSLGGFPVAQGGTAPYTYTWFVAAGPTVFGLNIRSAEHPTFTPIFEDSFTLRVQVRDSSVPSLTGSDDVIVRGVVVRANAGLDRQTTPGTSVPLGGSPTAVSGIAPFTYQWTLPTNPGSAGSLAGPTAANPSFSASVVGTYVASVRVTDALGCSGADSVVVDVKVGSDNGPGPSPLPDLCGIIGTAGLGLWASAMISCAGLLCARRRRR